MQITKTPIDHFINGRMVANTSGRRQDVTNRATGMVTGATELASCEGPIGCMCSSELSLRNWESPNPQNSQGTQPDEHP